MTTKNAADFWRRWTPWRHGDPGEGNFTDVMRVLGLYEYFANFVAAHNTIKGPVNILDLGCGAGQLAGPLTRALQQNGAEVQRYTGIDFADPDWMPPRVAREFERSGLSGRGHYLHHDLLDPLPPLTLGPEPLVITSCWCLTYLGLERIESLLKELSEIVADRPEPTWLFINMLTAGRFDRQVLTRRFLLEVVPKYIRVSITRVDREPMHELRLALKALPRMRVFGDELAEYVQLIRVSELISVVESSGYAVSALDGSALWGQTTSVAIRLQRVESAG